MAGPARIGLVLGASLASGFSSVFKTAKDEARGLKTALVTSTLGASSASEMHKLGARLNDLRARQAALGRTDAALNTEILKTERALGKASESAVRYGITIANAAEKERQFTLAATAAERQLKRRQAAEHRKEVRAEAKGQLLGTIGAIGTVAMPAREAIQFESAMADVKKVVNFETPLQFKQMGSDLLKLSTVIPMPAEGLAKIMAAAGQSGIAQTELLGFTESAAKMGIAFDISAENAGQMMANWRVGMGLSQPRVIGLADSVNYLSNNMNATASAIGEVIQRQGAVAMAAGLSEQKVAALGAAFLSSGAGPEIASTGLKNFTNALTKGDAATKAQQLAYAKLGLSSKKISINMQKDAEGTILTVLERLAKAPKHMQSALVSQLFGEESKGAIMPLLANLDNLRQAFGLVSDEIKFAGSMENEFKERSNTTANSLQLLGNTVTRSAINIGSILLPAINTTAKAFGTHINTLTALSEKYPTLTKVITYASVGLIGLSTASLVAKYAGTFLAGGLDAVIGAFNFFRPSVIRANAALLATRSASLGAAIGVRGLNLALLANPIGIVVAAIVAGAVVVYQHWGPIKSFFTGLWDGMSEGLGPLTSMLEGLGQTLEPIWQKAKKLWDVVSNFFTTADHDPSQVAESWGKRIGKKLTGWIPEVFGGEEKTSTASPRLSPAVQTAAAHGSMGAGVPVPAGHGSSGSAPRPVSSASGLPAHTAATAGSGATRPAGSSSPAGKAEAELDRLTAAAQKAQAALGEKAPGGKGGPAPITMNNTVNVTFTGMESVENAIKKALDAFSRDLESKLTAIRNQQARLSFGG
ncbi:phage tail tape measure protein [Solidesulfovibrio sp.]